MLSIAERHKYILDNLNKNGFVRITDIAQELGVTTVTVRKDIKILAEKGLLYKVHGSARPTNPHVTDTDVNIKNSINMEAKQRIAVKMASMIENNDSLIMSGGSTSYAVAQQMMLNQSLQNVNVVTTFLRISLLLSESDSFKVTQLGGPVHKNSLSTYGSELLNGFDFVCSKYILGVDGIDIEYGITTSTIEEARLTREMMTRASKIILVADSSKFGQRGFGRISGLDNVDMIVTDSSISKQMVSLIEDAGVEVVIA